MFGGGDLLLTQKHEGLEASPVISDKAHIDLSPFAGGVIAGSS